MTCRCSMCGRKNAGQKSRKHYLRCGVGRDEFNKPWGRISKRQESRLQRRRDKRRWKSEI